MIKTIDYNKIDNACHSLLEVVAGKDLPWNSTSIGKVREALVEALGNLGVELEVLGDGPVAPDEPRTKPPILIGDLKDDMETFSTERAKIDKARGEECGVYNEGFCLLTGEECEPC